METLDMEDYRHNFVNLTAFRLVDDTDLKSSELLQQMEQYQTQSKVRLLNASNIIKVSGIY